MSAKIPASSILISVTLGYITLQQTTGTIITLQVQQLIEVMRSKPDRMAAPAGAGGSSHVCPVQQRIPHGRDCRHRYGSHIGQPDQPSGGVTVCAHAADQTCGHTLRGIRTFDPVYLRRPGLAQCGFDRAAK